MPRPLIVLIGTHRSLSTCLAECCERMGLFLGEGRGGEDRELSWLLETLYPFPARELPGEGQQRFPREWIVAMLRRWLRNHMERAGDRPAAAKYPTLCFVLDELAEACQAEGVEPVWIDCARALPDSIRSIRTRCEKLRGTWVGADPAQAEALQIALFRAKWDFLRSHAHHRVAAPRLLAEPRVELGRLACYLRRHDVLCPPGDVDAAASLVSGHKAPHSDPGPARPWWAETTVVVKTHQRPECLHDLIVSIRAFAPAAQILVADDSQHPGNHWGADYYAQRPYDEGLSASRNWLVEMCPTEFLLLLDDDMLFCEDTDIQALFESVAIGGWEVAAGSVKRRVPFVSWRGRIELDGSTCRVTPGAAPPVPGGHPNGTPRYHLVDNFFVARRDALQRCPWDAELKVGEHLDWGLRARFDADLKCTALPHVRIVDRVHRTDRKYLAHRARAREFVQLSLRRWATRLGFTRLENVFHAPSSYDVPDPSNHPT